MSTTNLQLITCDLCQRRYNIDVYSRHRNENQCIKRNQSRLPFESIKQRSIQIGDQIFSVQAAQKNIDERMAKNREKRKQQIPVKNNNHKQSPEQLQRILPTNSRRRTLEQAKQLLQRRTKYQPPWIQKRSNLTKANATVLQTKDVSHKIVDRGTSPPTTKFLNDDLPIKTKLFSKNDKIPPSVSDHLRHNPLPFQQPIPTHSPKTRTSQVNRIDQTFSHEQPNSASRPARKANTWTRSSKQSTNRDVISPIRIPTFCESSSGPSHDQIIVPSNQNYDDDEFERYSPTPPPTPKYNQKIMIRPNTYQKAKRSDRQLYESKSDQYFSLTSTSPFQP